MQLKLKGLRNPVEKIGEEVRIGSGISAVGFGLFVCLFVWRQGLCVAQVGLKLVIFLY
jgi:hypothetical protein